MSFDSSRFTFDPWSDYLGVVMQQGRVQLDADWNEWVAQTMRRLQAGTMDVVGPSAVPRATTPDGFHITASSSGSSNQLTIGRGRIYVDGLLAENHGLPAPGQPKWTDGSAPLPAPSALIWDPRLGELVGTQDTPYDQQPYYFAPMAPPLPTTPGPHVVYLDVWQRELTHLQQPDLVEKAVNVDTTERLQTVWQVKVLADTGAGTACGADLNALLIAAGILPSASRLTTSAVDVPLPTDPCQIPSRSGYKGLENQLYRIEIHQDSAAPGGASFNWSRDNATVATRVTRITAPDTLVVESLGRDDVLRFNPLDWIEITDDWQELNGIPGEIHQIKAVQDATSTLTLQTALANPASYPVDGQGNTAPERHTRIRRWDQAGKIMAADGTTVYWDLDHPANNNVPAGTIPVPPPGTQVMLENGVLVGFSLDPAIASGIYKSRDFWAFAARTVDGTVERLADAPPRGIGHHYTQLAVVTFPDSATDCRTQWPPLPGGGAGCCCTVTVAAGDLGGETSLQSVLDRLKTKPGSAVCLEPGTYTLTEPLVFTAEHSGIALKGCGKGVRLGIKPGSEAAFQDGMVVVVNATDVSLEGLQFLIPEVPFTPVEDKFAGLALASLPPDMQVTVRNLVVSIGVRVVNGTSLSIRDCAFDFGDFEEDLSDKTGFGAGVFGGGRNDGIVLEGNSFAGVGPFMVGYLLAPAVAFNPPAPTKGPRRLIDFGPAVARNDAPLAGVGGTAAAGRSAAAGTTVEAAKRATAKKASAGQRLNIISEAAERIGIAGAMKALRPLVQFVSPTQNLAASGGDVLTPTLASATIRNNVFSGMDIAVLILAEPAGVEFSENEVSDGGGGLWVIAPQREALLVMNEAAALCGAIAGGYPLPRAQAVAMTSVPAPAHPVRFYAGATPFTDDQGNRWSPDAKATGVSVSGGQLNSSRHAITGALPSAADQALYQSERYGDFSYAIANVPGGYYRVTLKFAEIFDSAVGQRIFNVYINDILVLPDFDILASAGGPNIALDQAFDGITPSDGRIVIRFQSTGSPDPNPKVAAVELASELYQYPGNLNETQQFLAQVTLLGSQPYASRPGDTMDLRVDANDLEALQSTGALIIGFPSSSATRSVTMNGNVIRVAGARRGISFFQAAAVLLDSGIATITGNQLMNRAESGPCLLVWNSAQSAGQGVAVTGNVLQGNSVLPPRNLPSGVPAPMKSWEFMNTIL
jgi:malectin (di-glucose binding ER protein)/uncharacterized protein DUF6519